MAALLLGVVALIAIGVLVRLYVTADVKTVRLALQWVVLILLAAAALFLGITGRLGAAVAALAGLFAWGWRIMSLIQMGRQMGGMFGYGRAQENAGRNTSATMTEEEAYRVLGLAPGAGAGDINEAYRRLMSQAHPDHGGTDYLAAKINQARDLLLKKG